jgi:hypothetical protein
MIHARLRHQCSSLGSNLFHINITNDSKWQCGSLFKDSTHYIMEYPLHQNEHFKVKCKGQLFFQKFIHDETVDGIYNVVDIMSLL